MLKPFALDEALRSLDTVQLAKVSGRLVRMSGILLESLGCQQVTGSAALSNRPTGKCSRLRWWGSTVISPT